MQSPHHIHYKSYVYNILLLEYNNIYIIICQPTLATCNRLTFVEYIIFKYLVHNILTSYVMTLYASLKYDYSRLILCKPIYLLLLMYVLYNIYIYIILYYICEATLYIHHTYIQYFNI